MHHEHYIPKTAQQPLKLTLKEKLGLPEDYPTMNSAIGQGFKFDVVDSIAHETELSETEILNALNLPDWNKVQKRKRSRFTRVESNRIYALIEAVTAAEALFEGEACAAINWLKKRCRGLGGRSPIENLNSFIELQQVLALIHRLECGVFN
ncbi:antitoxin Xre/MbcA/ParS toxin-binding domain-containing protein [Idiomarina sp. PL1-037]|uniref:antitoxin Xre/MbcA/ParS toxin-binding domain-containing protein n=1 Tax=Idiomarina sp. PL1-037 TaxID=3095365 RepID=UPI002ACC1B2B|nr:antitoxin Xre/MbcA/ParS toxin-binding domain-containing protein [Idiomarina sp. PL1-037]WQC52602.1 antitoxin Xre/MbcA/ParS toxin-binding domain-containing protein [Idiomarina sp. PL1-037]